MKHQLAKLRELPCGLWRVATEVDTRTTELALAVTKWVWAMMMPFIGYFPELPWWVPAIAMLLMGTVSTMQLLGLGLGSTLLRIWATRISYLAWAAIVADLWERGQIFPAVPLLGFVMIINIAIYLRLSEERRIRKRDAKAASNGL